MTTNEKWVNIYKHNKEYKQNVKWGLFLFITLDILSFVSGILVGWIIWG